LHISGTKRETVIVKSAPKYRLDNEREILERFPGRPCIRQLIDKAADPPCLVMEHLDDNLLNASNTEKLDRMDIKFVARNILEALKVFHEAGCVHTGTINRPDFWGFRSQSLISSVDVKPDNILVNYGSGSLRFSKVTLADCGDTYHVGQNTDAKGNGHIIGAAIFRSPEAMLNLRWGTATDIWSFGATVGASV
jgi:casein kinase II subunit alpha